MIDYETYCKIHHLKEQKLNPAQIAIEMNLDQRTVEKWLQERHFRPRDCGVRVSKLDPFKPLIQRWLETHAYSAQQIFQRLQEEGFEGGYTLVKEYVRKIRPRRAPAFLTLSFAPGECAQVDWGEYGSVAVGSTRRKLSFFVMVLCYSRLMVVEFTLSQKMEQFLGCHQNAFQFFGGVPEKAMVDNLKSAVLRRLVGQAPVLNPRYRDFAGHWGFAIKPCGVRKGNEKGRVESGVGYVKKNLLNGLEISDFKVLGPAAKIWLDTIANVRMHNETHEQPVARFAQEKHRLRPLPTTPYDIGLISPVRASNRFRINFETNRYSVPAEYASTRLTLKAYPQHLCIYHQDKLIARHPRSFDRHQDFEDPDHPKALLAQRKNAREQKILARFLSLSTQAQAYYQGLAKRFNPQHHIRKIVALSEIYDADRVARAIEDALHYQAFSCEYITNLLESRTRLLPQASALHLTRRQDLLDLDIPEPDFSVYDTDQQEL
jgi:transposase